MTLLSDVQAPSFHPITNDDLDEVYWDLIYYEQTPEYKRLHRRGLMGHEKASVIRLLDRFTPDQLKEAANRYHGRDFYRIAPSRFQHFKIPLQIAALVADAYQTNPNALDEYYQQEFARSHPHETRSLLLSFSFLIGIGALIMYAIIRTHTHLTGLPAIGLSILVGGGGAIAMVGLLAQPAAEGAMTSLIGALAFVGMFALPILLLLLL